MNAYNEDDILKCFCCGNWIRRSATEIVGTGERSDQERWCLACIRAVDDYTDTVKGPDTNDLPSLDLLQEGEH
jgi:hypothetical protein